MEIFLLVFFVVLTIFLFIIGMAIDDNIAGFLLGISFLLSTLCAIEFACRISNKDERKLTPIEVYRDSVVILKNKEE